MSDSQIVPWPTDPDAFLIEFRTYLADIQSEPTQFDPLDFTLAAAHLRMHLADYSPPNRSDVEELLNQLQSTILPMPPTPTYERLGLEIERCHVYVASISALHLFLLRAFAFASVVLLLERSQRAHRVLSSITMRLQNMHLTQFLNDVI
jgi:hypothetical protein